MFEDSAKERAAKWIAGDIALSPDPGAAIKRWREMFGVSQISLAKALGISPSVVSDYEAGRRKSPGASIIKRIVEAFIRADEEQEGKFMKAFVRVFGTRLPSDVVLDLREFKRPVEGKVVCKAVEGEVVANKDALSHKLFGYTIIDSYKAVVKLTSEEFVKLYGLTAERVLAFTGVTTGRSPLVAIKVIGITPGMVILHGKLQQVDPLGVKIAELLRVPLVLSKLQTPQTLLEKLRKLAD